MSREGSGVGADLAQRLAELPALDKIVATITGYRTHVMTAKALDRPADHHESERRRASRAVGDLARRWWIAGAPISRDALVELCRDELDWLEHEVYSAPRRDAIDHPSQLFRGMRRRFRDALAQLTDSV
ncbi:hypothetical protein ACTXL6_00210 [Brachybacterium tyrofermentans]|uniref:hypothetical protein n=1 Tax=Brachybacterium tyrofermentans TaxID=47848 RepID=UPI003FCEF9A0